jgi:U32 family peptidase
VDLLAPLSAAKEVEPLVRAGATDLYCGLFDRGWARRWGLGSWPNRRGPGPANLGDLDELERTGREVADAGARLHLVLNAPLLDEEQEAAVLALARRAVDDLGVHGLITANPGLLRPLADTGALITASTLCTVRNAEAALLLGDLGARRIVLSRQLTLAEMRTIRERTPGLELEVFVLNDACVFEEGSCFTAHALPGWGGTYCLADRRVGEDSGAWARNKAWTDALGSRGFSAGGLPRGPCGLCALPALEAMGIDGVKVVGREAHPYRKVRSVQMVRHVLDGLEADGPAEATDRALVLRDDSTGCRAGFSCLYPEARPTDD